MNRGAREGNNIVLKKYNLWFSNYCHNQTRTKKSVYNGLFKLVTVDLQGSIFFLMLFIVAIFRTVGHFCPEFCDFCRCQSNFKYYKITFAFP